MTLDEIRQNVNFRLNKDYSGLSFTPEQFNTVLPLVSIEKFKQLYGLPEEYQKGQTFARIAWEVSRKVSDDLRKFIVSLDGKKKSQLKIDKFGIATLPSDYEHVSSIGFDYVVGGENFRKVITILKNNEFDARAESTISIPSKKRPVCTFVGNEVHFLPRDLGMVKFDYLRLPLKPFYATTEDPVTEVLVYDPANSVELEWPETVQTDIVAMLIKYAAENLGIMPAIEITERRKQLGV